MKFNTKFNTKQTTIYFVKKDDITFFKRRTSYFYKYTNLISKKKIFASVWLFKIRISDDKITFNSIFYLIQYYIFTFTTS